MALDEVLGLEDLGVFGVGSHFRAGSFWGRTVAVAVKEEKMLLVVRVDMNNHRCFYNRGK